MCDRVIVMYKGRPIREFARGEATKADVMYWIAGGEPELVAQAMGHTHTAPAG